MSSAPQVTQSHHNHHACDRSFHQRRSDQTRAAHTHLHHSSCDHPDVAMTTTKTHLQEVSSSPETHTSGKTSLLLRIDDGNGDVLQGGADEGGAVGGGGTSPPTQGSAGPGPGSGPGSAGPGPGSALLLSVNILPVFLSLGPGLGRSPCSPLLASFHRPECLSPPAPGS